MELYHIFPTRKKGWWWLVGFFLGATRFLCSGNAVRKALAGVFAPVGVTTNLGRAANRASAIACGASHLRLKAAFQLLHSPTHNSPTFPSALRGMDRATASPSGFRRPPSHENRLRGTRTRLLRRLHEYSTTESRYCPFDVKAKVEQGPYDIIRVHSCRA